MTAVRGNADHDDHDDEGADPADDFPGGVPFAPRGLRGVLRLRPRRVLGSLRILRLRIELGLGRRVLRLRPGLRRRRVRLAPKVRVGPLLFPLRRDGRLPVLLSAVPSPVVVLRLPVLPVVP